MIRVLFIGLLVGLIMVGGLVLGFLWLIKSRDESLSESAQTKFGLLGVSVLVGQFLIAGLILYYSEGLSDEPLALAGGILSMNLVLPLLFGKMILNKKPGKKDLKLSENTAKDPSEETL